MGNANAEIQLIKQQARQCYATNLIASHPPLHMQLGLYCSDKILKISVTARFTIIWSVVKQGKNNKGWCHWIATRRAKQRAVQVSAPLKTFRMRNDFDAYKKDVYIETTSLLQSPVSSVITGPRHGTTCPEKKVLVLKNINKFSTLTSTNKLWYNR